MNCSKCNEPLIPEEIRANRSRAENTKLCIGCFFDSLKGKPLTLIREDEQGNIRELVLNPN